MFALLAVRSIFRKYDDLNPCVDWGFVFGMLAGGLVCDCLVVLAMLTMKVSFGIPIFLLK